MSLPIEGELSARELWSLACRERNRRAARRMLAIANALEGASRADAAASAGMERQALRDAVVRYNAEGVAGLYDRGGQGRPRVLSEGEMAVLAERIYGGPDPDRDGTSAWTLADLCRWIETAFGKRITHQGLSRILRREWFSRQNDGGAQPRPSHPKVDVQAQERFKKGAARCTGRRRASQSGQADSSLLSRRDEGRPKGAALP